MIELFRHNFDVEEKKALNGEGGKNAEALADLRTQLDTARQEGFDAGRTIGKQDAQAEMAASDAERLARVRDSIAAQLQTLAAQDNRHAEETEKDITELFCTIAERLVPELLDSFGVDLAVERIRQSVRLARSEPRLSIRTSPEVLAVLEDEAPDWLDDATRHTEIEFLADPQMNRGAATVDWQAGRLEYDLNAACFAVLTALQDAAETFNKNRQEAG